MLKIDTKVLRVWRASKSLRSLIPKVKEVPRHDPREHGDIGNHTVDPLAFTTCDACEFHVDWHQALLYIVVRGGGVLRVGHRSRPVSKGISEVLPPWEWPRAYHEVRVAVGDVIQLWPMAPHDFESTRTPTTFLSLYGYKTRRFMSVEDQEAAFRVHLLDPRVKNWQLRPISSY